MSTVIKTSILSIFLLVVFLNALICSVLNPILLSHVYHPTQHSHLLIFSKPQPLRTWYWTFLSFHPRNFDSSIAHVQLLCNRFPPDVRESTTSLHALFFLFLRNSDFTQPPAHSVQAAVRCTSTHSPHIYSHSHTHVEVTRYYTTVFNSNETRMSTPQHSQRHVYASCVKEWLKFNYVAEPHLAKHTRQRGAL